MLRKENYAVKFSIDKIYFFDNSLSGLFV